MQSVILAVIELDCVGERDDRLIIETSLQKQLAKQGVRHGVHRLFQGGLLKMLLCQIKHIALEVKAAELDFDFRGCRLAGERLFQIVDRVAVLAILVRDICQQHQRFTILRQ